MNSNKSLKVSSSRLVISLFVICVAVLMVFVFVGCANTSKVEDVEGKGDLVTFDNGDIQFEKKGGSATSEWVKVNGTWYYFGADSKMVKNSIVDDMYYVGEDGTIKCNYWYKDPVTNNYYYFGNDGTKLKSTWIKDNDDWYYVDDNGAMVRDKWVDTNYYVDASGKMLKNTITPDGYVVDAEGKFFDVKAFQEAQAAAIAKAKAAKVKKVIKTTPFNNKKPFVGQEIKMGNWQNSPLSWYVLDVQPGKALLLSKEIVDFIPYNTTFVDTNWAKSSLRYWLNDTFFNGSFTDGSSVYIIPSSITTPANPRTETKGGAATYDKLFLLSAQEAYNQYSSVLNGKLFAKTTSYAASVAPPSNSATWATRTPGTSLKEVVVVTGDGNVDYIGAGVDLKHGVRPAMWVKY